LWEGLTEDLVKLKIPKGFWEKFIEYIIEMNLDEDFHWDYKSDYSIGKQTNKIDRERVNREILKDISAFSNADSGILIYGISDKQPRVLSGVNNPEMLINKTMDLLEKKCEKRINIKEYIVKIKQNSEIITIVIFLIPKSPYPIAITDIKTGSPIYYIRKGLQSKPITKAIDLEQLIEEKMDLKEDSYPVLTIIQKYLKYPKIKIPKSLIDKYENNKLAKREDKIISNLVHLNIPNSIFSATTEFRDPAKVDISYRKYPFILRDGKLYSLMPFNDNNKLREIIDTDTIEEYEVMSIIGNEKVTKYLIQLLNRWVHNYLYAKGLKYDKRTNCYYFISSRNLKQKWDTGKKIGNRFVVKFYKNKDGNLSYVINQAIKARIINIDYNFFLRLNPRLIITEDGFKCKSGETTKKLITSMTSNPVKFHNENQRMDFLFWHDFITKASQKHPITQHCKSSKRIKERVQNLSHLRSMIRIGEPLSFLVNWKPQTEVIEESETDEELDWLADYFNKRSNLNV